MRWVAAVSKDLQAHRGSSVVIAGDTQPAAVHALAHAINLALGNAGRTVVYADPIEAAPTDQLQNLRDLAGEMNAGSVDVLVIVGGNPVYSAPADLTFADALGKVPLRIHLSPHLDETSALCHWQIPEAHFLESWSDARAYDGTVSIVQPVIAPLYAGRSAHEVIGAMSETPEKSPYDLVREHWMARAGGAGFTGSRRTSCAGCTSAQARRSGPGVRAGVAEMAARRGRSRHRPAGEDADARGRVRCGASAAGERRVGGHRDRLPSRSGGARWAICEQRVAAGASQADHQADMGQRGDGQPGDRPTHCLGRPAARRDVRRRARARGRPGGRAAFPRPHGARSALHGRRAS